MAGRSSYRFLLTDSGIKISFYSLGFNLKILVVVEAIVFGNSGIKRISTELNQRTDQLNQQNINDFTGGQASNIRF